MDDARGATTTAPSAESGPRTDRLEVLQQLGGTVGTVQKARHPKLNRTVALRQIQVPEWLDDVDELIKKILAEAKAASALDHPHIARLFTGGYKGFTIFLTSEFVEGTGIREYVSGHNLGVPEILTLGKQLCSALDFAHQKSIFHNALSPANLKISANGTLKVLDIGLLRDRQMYSPSPAKRLESEHYLSPEQLKNKPVNAATNVFSAATILYELLTTRNPFAGKHLGEVDRNISEMDPAPASQAHARVSEALSKVLMKALAKHSLARYQTCADFAKALDEALRESPGKPVAAASTTPSAGVTPSSRPAGNVSTAVRPASTTSNSHPPSPVPAAPPATNASAEAAPQAKPAAPVRASGTTVRNNNTAPVVPSKMPVRVLTQWRLVGGLVAAVFVVSAVAITLTHRSKVPPVAPEAIVENSQGKPVQASMAVPEVAEVPPTIDVREAHSSTEKQRKSRTEPTLARVSGTDGVLQVSSEPEGAQFSIEGRTTDSWTTPFVVPSLAPALYKVTATKPGYSSESGYVQVVGGNRATINLKLKSLKATLNVGGTAGASIVIDGKETGKFSPAEFTLEPAVHTVSLRKEGFFDNTGQIKLVAGQTVSYSPSMVAQGRTDNIRTVGGFKKLFGGSSAGMVRMEIRTDPKGAQVLINGASLPKTTPLDIQIDPGNYEIVLQKEGYKPVHKILAVGPTDKVRIDEHLLQ